MTQPDWNDLARVVKLHFDFLGRSGTIGRMTFGRPACVQKIADALFGGAGETDPGLRRAVAAHAEALGAGTAPSDAVPADLRAYVEKVAKHAYRITDDDIAALKAAGHSEDMIFEITSAAALGAALVRMDRALDALADGA